MLTADSMAYSWSVSDRSWSRFMILNAWSMDSFKRLRENNEQFVCNVPAMQCSFTSRWHSNCLCFRWAVNPKQTRRNCKLTDVNKFSLTQYKGFMGSQGRGQEGGPESGGPPRQRRQHLDDSTRSFRLTAALGLKSSNLCKSNKKKTHLLRLVRGHVGLKLEVGLELFRAVLA